MAEYDTKAVLLDLMKEGENKTCIDCGVPMPQWASLSFGVFCCLTCSGAHRGLGVHISFVRSLTMDKWTDAQVKKMKTGGNEKARKFFEASPDYDKSMSIQDKYTSHFATQYKDKLTAECEGRTWVPSDTPPPASTTSSSLRKPRATGSRGASPAPLRSESPLSPGAQGGVANPYNQKAANESYFASMGSVNASRPADLPPSQGGRYGGFGSEPSYVPSSRSSNRLPGVDDFRDDPVAALNKGWGFLGAALSQVSKTVNETVIQPTIERANDPALQSQLSGVVNRATTVLGEASRRGGEVLASGLQSSSDIIRRDLGYNVGDLGAHVVERYTGRGAGQGYNQVGTFQVPSADAQEHGEDFFESQLGTTSNSKSFYQSNEVGASSSSSYGGASTGAIASSSSSSSSSLPPREATTQAATSWASLAPQTVARAAGGSGRNSPSASALPAAKKASAKKDDGWDDFGDWQ